MSCLKSNNFSFHLLPSSPDNGSTILVRAIHEPSSISREPVILVVLEIGATATVGWSIWGPSFHALWLMMGFKYKGIRVIMVGAMDWLVSGRFRMLGFLRAQETASGSSHTVQCMEMPGLVEIRLANFNELVLGLHLSSRLPSPKNPMILFGIDIDGFIFRDMIKRQWNSCSSHAHHLGLNNRRGSICR